MRHGSHQVGLVLVLKAVVLTQPSVVHCCAIAMRSPVPKPAYGRAVSETVTATEEGPRVLSKGTGYCPRGAQKLVWAIATPGNEVPSLDRF